MFKRVFFVLICFVVMHSQAIAATLKGKLLLNNGEAVAFASIISIDFKNVGAVTREDGGFEIEVPELMDSYKLFMTAGNIIDTTLEISSWSENQIIYVEPDIFQMDEVTVSASKNDKIQTIRWDERGNRKVYGSMVDDNFEPSLFTVESKGHLFGNSFRLNKRSRILEIGVYVWKNDSLPQRLIIRLFEGEKPEGYGKNTPLNKINELTGKPIIYDIIKSGYAKIDVRDLNITVDADVFHVAIVPDLLDGQKNKLPVVSLGETNRNIGMFLLNSQYYTVIHPRINAFYIGVKYLELEDGSFLNWIKGVFK